MDNNMTDEEKEKFEEEQERLEEERYRLKELQEQQTAFYKWGKYFFMALTGAVALFVFAVIVGLLRGPMGFF